MISKNYNNPQTVIFMIFIYLNFPNIIMIELIFIIVVTST